MSVHSRREQIIRILNSSPINSASSIAKAVGASRETIRRDLLFLKDAGLLPRNRGNASPSGIPLPDPSVIDGQSASRQRRQRIAKLASQQGTVRTKELAILLGVSAATIRADLIALEAEGLVRRSHGAATATRTPTSDQLLTALIDLPFLPSIRKVGERAISHVERGDLLFLDDSLFGAYIASNLAVDAGADIITNSLRVALILSQRQYGGETFMLPGGVQRDAVAADHKFLASMAERFLIGKAFLALTAYSRERGFFSDSPRHADLLTAIAGTSQSVYLLLDSRNAGLNGKYAWSLGANRQRLAELCVDDGLGVEEAQREFPDDLPLVLCSESYAIKSPFNKQYLIGFAALHGKSEFSRLVREGVEAAARKRSSIEIIVADNKLDRQTTLSNVDAFIENKVDLVIEYQHDYSLGTLIGEKLSHANIPVIAVDIPIPGAVYFGAHNYRAGVLGGTAAAEEVRQRWQGSLDNLIVVADSAAGALPENRITGMLDTFLSLVPYPRDRIIRIDSGNDPDAVAAELGKVLNGLPPAARNLVFSMNSFVTEGILRAVAVQDRGRNTLVAGHNVTPRIAEELQRKDSPLIGAVSFYPEQYGERIMELAEKILEKRPVSPDNYTEHRWIGRQFAGAKKRGSIFNGMTKEPTGGSNET